MAQMLVRNIDDAVAARFKARAKAEGKSAEQVLREMVGRYAAAQLDDSLATLDAIRAGTVGKAIVDPVAILRFDRDTSHGRDWALWQTAG